MKTLILIFAISLSAVGFSQEKWQDGFQLRYSFAGLGSNMGSSFAGFKLEGNHYEFVTEVNSCYDGQSTPAELEFEGELSDEIMDGLMTIFNEIPDTSIYETNLSVLSGGVHTITMGSAVKMVKFTLHNASHPTAVKIIELLNSAMPEDMDGRNKLWLHREATNETH